MTVLAVLGLLFETIWGRIVEDGFPQCLWIGDVPWSRKIEEAGSAERVVGQCAVCVCDGEVDVVLVEVTVAVGVVYGVDGPAFNSTSDFAGIVGAECAFWLVLVAGPNAVTVTISNEFIRVFSIRGGSRTMKLIHMLVKVSEHLIRRLVC